MGLLNFIPGFKTLEGIGKGLGKLLKGDIGGAVKAVGKGLANDWGLGIATIFVPGLNALGMAQLGAVGLDVVGAFGSENEGDARQQDSVQYAQGQLPEQGGYDTSHYDYYYG